MSQTNWNDHVSDLHGLLEGLIVTRGGEVVDVEEGFAAWLKMAVELRASKGTIFLVGNGASASMASHYAADLAKNAQLHTEVFSDLSLITAISNDMGYEHVFAEPLSRRAKPGDMLIGISSSGRSPNVLKAVEVAKKMGVVIVSLSAMDEDNPLRTSSDLGLYVPAKTYGYAESCHAAILHHWMDLVEASG